MNVRGPVDLRSDVCVSGAEALTAEILIDPI
jgi:hypothetical protein